jgi:hypothetical protein
MVNRRPQLQIIAPAASPDEAAAVVAALERFMRDTAPPPASGGRQRPSGWLRTAMLEAVDRRPHTPTAWGDPHPWGS